MWEHRKIELLDKEARRGRLDIRENIGQTNHKTSMLKVQDFIRGRGFGDAILYGPCHGIGLMECEHPWMELNSEYLLQENFTFQVDSFLHTKDYGARWEDGVRITKDGVEQFSTYRRELIVI